MRADAEAYRDAKISIAKGEADRFMSLYEEYQKAPEITRRRLYLETMPHNQDRNLLLLNCISHRVSNDTRLR